MAAVFPPSAPLNPLRLRRQRHVCGRGRALWGGDGADDRAGRLAGKSSYAGAAVCFGAGEYAPPGDTTCSACPAGNLPPPTTTPAHAHTAQQRRLPQNYSNHDKLKFN